MKEWQKMCLNKSWVECIFVPMLWFILGGIILFFYTWHPNAYGDELSIKRVHEFVETCTYSRNDKQCNTKLSITTTENREASMFPLSNPLMNEFMLRRFESTENLDTYHARVP